MQISDLDFISISRQTNSHSRPTSPIIERSSEIATRALNDGKDSPVGQSYIIATCPDSAGSVDSLNGVFREINIKSTPMDDDFSTIESENLFSSTRPFCLLSSRFDTMEVEKQNLKKKFDPVSISTSDEGKRKKVKASGTPLHSVPNNPISEKRPYRETLIETDQSSEMNSFLDTFSKKSRHKFEEKDNA